MEEERPPQDPCNPSPCGANSQCRSVNGHAVCSCVAGYIGAPPTCRPECVVSSDCPADKACANQKCRDPCPGTCGLNARCHVANHNPICSCKAGFEGDPFVRCLPIVPCKAPLLYLYCMILFFGCCTNSLHYCCPFSSYYASSTGQSVLPVTLWTERAMPRNQRPGCLQLFTQLFRPAA